MKYAFNTWAYSSYPTFLPAYPLDEAIRRLAAIGYDGVEIGCAAPHAWPPYLNNDRRRQIRRLLVHVHASDKDRLLPGEGRVDWPGFMQALLEAKFDGFVTMEIGIDSRLVDPDRIARTALTFLREVEAQLQREPTEKGHV